LIVTLLITLSIECAIVLGYVIWCKKPILPILLTSICGNLITQSLLWISLNLFFQQYLLTLLVAEILIWLLESLLLYYIPWNHLSFKEAILLSLGMNASSVALGWFLPV
jgi:hypothetical protein